ncbi:TlpA family protein disulfide reductase [Acidipila sp. 4G-K13]|uniref:TlpA family protein disulfide reductase n=2 Tax=Paracidobacterium acidisoli TaxID=2303751 RepID=A0A372ILF4_9BACT|nr:TlpA family protein disulfide reductase [Paracidobacterium acidisoli]
MNPLRRILIVSLLALLPSAAFAGKTPNLSLKDLSGQTQKLSSLKGQIVVLNFWATWCGPCQEELPRLSAMAQKYAGKNVHFVAVSIDAPKDRSKIEPLIHKLNVNLDVWSGADADTLDRFGLGNIVPATIVIDDQGKIVTRIMGEARNEDVSTTVDWLLGGRSGAAPEAKIKRY